MSLHGRWHGTRVASGMFPHKEVEPWQQLIQASACVNARRNSIDHRSAAVATTLRVTINGTNISTMVDGAGQFTMNGVPPGTVTLTFTGEGVSASITLNNVNAGDEIRIDVRLNGNSARIESETRRQGDDDDDDDEDRDEANEVKGTVSALSGTCPALTFTVGTRLVRTGSATVFDDRCTDVTNGVRVEVRGTRMNDGTFTAARVEVDD
jgi:hypothetical protein